MRRRLSTQLLQGFGITVVGAVLIGGLSMWLVAQAITPSWQRTIERLRTYTGLQFAKRWDDPAARDAFAQELSDTLNVSVTVVDTDNTPIFHTGLRCETFQLNDPHTWVRSWSAPVVRDGTHLGQVIICEPRSPFGLINLGVLFLVMIGVLWWGIRRIAHRITRPLDELIHVARDIGRGRFDRRPQLREGAHTELTVLADAMHDMAARIETQLQDQRALLAGVSHELRTPLGHMHILLELAREDGIRDDTLRELEREMHEMEMLVGQLLASARLDFELRDVHRLNAAELARQALARLGLPDTHLDCDETADLEVEGDPTLLARALANLLHNAETHGEGLQRLVIEPQDNALAFIAIDDGPGLPVATHDALFEPFAHASNHAQRRDGHLGLGLFLVKRIALAHHGDVLVDPSRGHGAALGFTLPTRQTS